jgi:hypothetical protein
MALVLVAVDSGSWVFGGPSAKTLSNAVVAGDVLEVWHFTQGSGGANMNAPGALGLGETWTSRREANEATWAPAIRIWTCTIGSSGAAPTITMPQVGSSGHKPVIYHMRGAVEAPTTAEGFGDSTSSHVTPSANAGAAGALVKRGVVTRGGGTGAYAWPTSTESSDEAAGSGAAGGVASTAHRTATGSGAQGTETLSSATSTAVAAWGEYISATSITEVAAETGADGTITGDLPVLDGQLAGASTAASTVTGQLPALGGQLAGAGTATGAVTGDLPAPDGALAAAGTANGSAAGDLPALDGQLAGASLVASTVAGDLPALDGALTGVAEVASAAGALTGDLPALDGALAAAGTGVVLLSGNLPELDGQLVGTVVSGAAGAVVGDLPALGGALAGTGMASGVLAGSLPELIGPILGTVVGGVTRRLRAQPTTTVDIYAPAAVPDEWSGARGSETLAAGGVIASIIEQTQNVNDPRTGTPRVVRTVTGRVPDGTPVEPTSRIVDGEGRTYAVSAVRQVRNPVWTGDIVLNLVRTDQQSP